VTKLREVISIVQTEKKDALQAADGLATQLGQEKTARTLAEQKAAVLQQEVDYMQSGTQSKTSEAESALQAFRDEISQMTFEENQAVTEILQRRGQ